jgi:23S rRNA pseudouridine955/2504/2580 synthase
MENASNNQMLTVSYAESGQKLLNFLLRRIDATVGELHRWIRTGQVRVNGSRAKAFDRIEEGDRIRTPPFAQYLAAGSDSHQTDVILHKNDSHRLPFPVVYEDKDLLVIAKPAGLPVQGGTGHKDSVAAYLAKVYCRSAFVPAPVHRLDKDTTGLLVAGKSYAAVRYLTDALADRTERSLQKEYLAWVQGSWDEGIPHELHDILSKDRKQQRMVILDDASEEDGQEARCLVSPIERRVVQHKTYTLMRIQLLTGRTHQIRIQLASRGYTIVGDPWYGDRTLGHGYDLKLHAFRLFLPCIHSEKLLQLSLLPSWKSPWQVEHLPE